MFLLLIFGAVRRALRDSQRAPPPAAHRAIVPIRRFQTVVSICEEPSARYPHAHDVPQSPVSPSFLRGAASPVLRPHKRLQLHCGWHSTPPPRFVVGPLPSQRRPTVAHSSSMMLTASLMSAAALISLRPWCRPHLVFLRLHDTSAVSNESSRWLRLGALLAIRFFVGAATHRRHFRSGYNYHALSRGTISSSCFTNELHFAGVQLS
jgi:hypothetical protein